jgi:hypothetical protein
MVIKPESFVFYELDSLNGVVYHMVDCDDDDGTQLIVISLSSLDTN